MLFKIRSY